ncbi:MAG: M55 family metallopeptidase [Bacillota bacterium]|jgi:D-amino peptidase|nr:M55 family metallopeptidase [Bacillota bacterium]
MKVFISADIEGITGVVDAELQTGPAGRDYEKARRLMTQDVNAAISGAFDGGATEVVVSDGHGASANRNILLEELDPRAEAVVGSPKPLTQMEGIDSTFGLVMLVGYHARMGSNGILSHTISGGAVANVWINDTLVGETGINSLLAGGFGVPVGLVTGDQCVSAEAKALMPWVDTVIVKHAITRSSARCLSPVRTKELIHAAAVSAVKATAQGKYKPLVFSTPLTYKLQLINSGLADKAGRMGEERIDPTTFRIVGDCPIRCFKKMRALIGLAQG